MEVLYYNEPAFYPSFGGVQNVAYNLVESLNKKIKVTYFPRAKPTYGYLNSFVNVQSKYALGRFDIVHYNIVPNIVNTSAFILNFSKIKHIPTVFNVHGILQIEHEINKINKSTSYELIKTLNTCKLADSIIVNTYFMKSLIQNFYDVKEKKLVVIPNGINVSRFTNNDSKLNLDGDPTILFVGTFAKIKGLDVLLDAIAKIHKDFSNLKLHVVGGGYLEDIRRIQVFLKSKGIEDHVVFHGVVNHSVIPFYLNSVEICVFPSRHEGFGIAVLEAMASKKPVVVSNIPPFREIGSDGKDFLMFTTEDSDALARAIIKLIHNTTLKEKISLNAYNKSLEYDWDIIAEKYINHYNKLSKPFSSVSTIRKQPSSTPLVSIGLPVFNGEAYLKEALNSILAQTYGNFELIICNNCSSDATEAICLDYASKDRRIRYYRNNVNIGAAMNHNKVFELSSGEYFKWASYDDILAPNFLKKCVDILRKDDNVVLCHSITGKIDEYGKLTGSYQYNIKTHSYRVNERLEEIMSSRNHAWIQLLGLIKYDALKKTNLIGDFISSDRKLLTELALIGPFKQVPEMLFYRRAHSLSYTNKNYNSYQDKTRWWTAGNCKSIVLPNWRMFREYYVSVKHSSLTVFDRLKCNLELVKWLFREGLIFMCWDLVLAVSENTGSRRILGPFGKRLSKIFRIK